MNIERFQSGAQPLSYWLAKALDRIEKILADGLLMDIISDETSEQLRQERETLIVRFLDQDRIETEARLRSKLVS